MVAAAMGHAATTTGTGWKAGDLPAWVYGFAYGGLWKLVPGFPEGGLATLATRLGAASEGVVAMAMEASVTAHGPSGTPWAGAWSIVPEAIELRHGHHQKMWSAFLDLEVTPGPGWPPLHVQVPAHVEDWELDIFYHLGAAGAPPSAVAMEVIKEVGAEDPQGNWSALGALPFGVPWPDSPAGETGAAGEWSIDEGLIEDIDEPAGKVVTPPAGGAGAGGQDDCHSSVDAGGAYAILGGKVVVDVAGKTISLAPSAGPSAIPVKDLYCAVSELFSEAALLGEDVPITHEGSPAGPYHLSGAWAVTLELLGSLVGPGTLEGAAGPGAVAWSAKWELGGAGAEWHGDSAPIWVGGAGAAGEGPGHDGDAATGTYDITDGLAAVSEDVASAVLARIEGGIAGDLAAAAAGFEAAGDAEDSEQAVEEVIAAAAKEHGLVWADAGEGGVPAQKPPKQLFQDKFFDPPDGMLQPTGGFWAPGQDAPQKKEKEKKVKAYAIVTPAKNPPPGWAAAQTADPVTGEEFAAAIEAADKAGLAKYGDVAPDPGFFGSVALGAYLSDGSATVPAAKIGTVFPCAACGEFDCGGAGGLEACSPKPHVSAWATGGRGRGLAWGWAW